MRKAILNGILALQKRLKPFTKAQIEYAHSHYERVGYLKRGGEIWCQCCGHIYRQLPGVIDIDLELGGQCPECGAHLNLDRKRGKHHTEGYYTTYITHVDGWQVFRTVLAQRCNTYGISTHYYMDEVYQNWISPDGKEYILSKGYTRSPLIGEKWAYDTPLNKPREHNANYTGCYALGDMFDVTGNYIYPRVSITPTLKRNGWDNRFLKPNISPVEVCKALLSFPALEMLAKTQRELFLHLLRTGRTEFPVHVVKICNRNNYRIADPDIWLDHIDNLQRLNLDTHNAHYVCPADIYAEHERLANRIRSEEKKKELEARRAEMKKWEAKYQETKGKFFGICFGNENIVVTVIQSVQEMEHEGTAMHHCVYVNEYYKKAYSLILSAKDKLGNRIETVEVNTQTFKVVQSRGVCNQNTPHHNEIINLVNNNMYRIRQAI